MSFALHRGQESANSAPRSALCRVLAVRRRRPATKERETSTMKNLVTRLVLCAALVLPAVISRPARAAKHPTNACGCYSQGNACFCEKKAKCGCPGECEPKGCEAERQKRLQKEIEEETRKAKEAEQAQIDKAEAEAKAKEEARAAKDPEAAGEAANAKGDTKGGRKAPARTMTSAQRKKLRKLIDAYLAENPDAADRILTDVRAALEDE